MNRTLIFFDIDGTILDDRYHAPESAVSAIRACRENGHICVVNTGRPFSHIEPVVKEIGFDGYVCSCGQHILLGGTSVYYRRLPPAVCRTIVHLVRRCRLDVVLEDEEGIWFDHTRPMCREVQDACSHFAARGFDVERPIDRPDLQFEKFCVWTNRDSDPAPLFAYAEAYGSFIDRGNNLYEFVMHGCSKEFGTNYVIAHTGIPADRCYAIGDSPNDLPMLRAVSHSIAMGNAPQTVKEAAQYVTGDLHQDGIRQALIHYGLI